MILGKLFDEKIEAVLEKPIPIAIVLILGGVILVFIDRVFKNSYIDKEEIGSAVPYDIQETKLKKTTLVLDKKLRYQIVILNQNNNAVVTKFKF